jgi:alkanesulfonate monooxygenase SsuD/methylene tetrahydromethanopterin reductase-like flavin-dependent oxidoreductase (luciferase family)
MTKMLMLFDMRVPDIGPPAATVYSEALEMARFADRVGFDYISISEHHGSEDSYLPAPFVMAAAVAGRTNRIRIILNALILPLHDPVEVAEQIAVLDHVSQGRLEVIFGAGYVPGEFARAGVPLSERGRLLDEGLDIIVRALAGERFEARGREVFVRPLPHQRPHPPFICGGGAPVAARRAARLGFGFAPMKPDLFDCYSAECAKLNKSPGAYWGLQGPIMVHVAEDPEAAWQKLEPHLMHVANTYARWAAEANDATSTYSGLHDFDVVRRSGKYAVVTPDECVELAARQDALHSSLIFQPMIGGLAIDEAWRSLHLFANEVLPRLRAKAESRTD